MFDGPMDEMTGLHWMLNHVTDTVRMLDKQATKTNFSENKAERLEVGKELKSDLNARINQLKVDPSTPDEGLIEGGPGNQSLWERFIFVQTGNELSYYEQEGRNPPYFVGEWDAESEIPITFGWSNEFVKTETPKKLANRDFSTHYYQNPPPEQKWKMSRVGQKGRNFLIGSVEIGQIDAFCSVPQLPKEMNSSETAGRILNKKKGVKEWQRRVDRKRVSSIKRFIGISDDNLIANAVILYVPENQDAVTFSEGNVIIDPSKYLFQKQDLYQSSRGKRDYRPIWIIDGQHRTRGLAQSENGIRLKIPVILFPSDFDLSEAAKIFSEINTLQVNLDSLHKLFMQHRFSISSTSAKRDFSLPFTNDKGQVINFNSRANHMSYECAAALASDFDGALYQKIQFLDSNGTSSTIMKANSWIDYSRQWFLPGGVYAPETPQSEEWIIKEVGNFFEAFKRNCNHAGWNKSNAPNPNKPRWSKGSGSKGVIHSHSSSKALLMIYNKTWRKARANQAVASDNIIPVSRFEEVLSPLKWCDWIDSEVEEIYKGSGEPPRTALILWMTAAIDNGITYGYEEVHNSQIKSKAGQGFLAPSGPGSLTRVSENDWPLPGKPVKFKVEQPLHSFASGAIRVQDKIGTDMIETTRRAKEGILEYNLKHEAWMEKTDEIKFRVSWRNRVNPRGYKEIKLKKTS